MLDMYANQTIAWKQKTGTDDFNDSTYAAAVNIKARFEYKRQIIRDRYGQEKVSEAQCYTETAVNVDDIITYDGIDWPVKAITSNCDLDGTVIFYEVSL